MIILNGVAMSTCTLRVLVTAETIGEEYKLEPPNWADLKTEKYKAEHHPFGKVPSIKDGDFKVYESRAIVRYLIAKKGSSLIPTDPKKLAIFEQYASVEYSYFNPAMGDLLDEKIFKPMTGRGDSDPAIVEKHKEKLASVLDVYEKLLAGKQFLLGDEVSAVDLLHISSMHYINQTELAADLWGAEKRPNCARWWNNISSLPAWKRALAHQQKK